MEDMVKVPLKVNLLRVLREQGSQVALLTSGGWIIKGEVASEEWVDTVEKMVIEGLAKAGKVTVEKLAEHVALDRDVVCIKNPEVIAHGTGSPLTGLTELWVDVAQIVGLVGVGGITVQRSVVSG